MVFKERKGSPRKSNGDRLFEESKWDSEWGVMLHLTGALGITNEERGILRERFHHFLLN